MAKKIVLNPGWPRAKNPGFAQATQVGDTIYVAGQVAQDPDGNLVGPNDMAAQSRQVFANIEAILAVAGATMSDVTKITAYVTDMSRYGEYSAVRAEVFPKAQMASATVASPTLVRSDFLVEVEAIAVVGCGG
jgi:enamine deaminase RidA (YjgF/YER057c/UK114 family)